MAKYLDPKAELYAIDKYWDRISRERTLENAAERRGEAKGLAKGLAEGRAEERYAIARNLLSMGMTQEQVCQATGLSPEEIATLQ